MITQTTAAQFPSSVILQLGFLFLLGLALNFVIQPLFIKYRSAVVVRLAKAYERQHRRGLSATEDRAIAVRSNRYLAVHSGVIAVLVTVLIAVLFAYEQRQTLVLIIAAITGLLSGGLFDYLKSSNKRRTATSKRTGIGYGIFISFALASGLALVFFSDSTFVVGHNLAKSFNTITVALILSTIVFITALAGKYHGSSDDLAGGLLSILVGSLGVAALVNHQYVIAVFCFVLVAGFVAYLWSNAGLPEFLLGEAGLIAGTAVAAVAAIQVGAVLLLPFAGFMFFAQALSKVFAKLFVRSAADDTVADLYGWLQQRGWTEYMIKTRAWTLALILAMFGVALHVVGGNYV